MSWDSWGVGNIVCTQHMHRMPYLDGARVSNENITLSLNQTYTTTLYM